MNVITKYPIITTNSTAQSDAVYRSTYSGADGVATGTMEVTTDYPIVYTNSNAQSKSEYRSTYSAAFGDGWLTTAAGRERRRKRREERKRTGTTFGDKVKKAGQSPIVQGLLGNVLGGGSGAGAIDASAMPPIEETPKGMSKGMKIGLIVGGVAILGLGAFLLLRKKK
jgi:hypothetical protein